MDLRRTRRWLLGALLAAAGVHAGAANAIDVQQLIRETQQLAQDSGQMTMVWWIPQEFWQASLSANPGLTAQGREQFLSVLEDYQVVILLRARAGVAGISDVPSREALMANARFSIGSKVLEPVAADKISPGMQSVLAALKPMLSGMLGQFGQGMQLVVYPAKQGSERLIDPTRASSFDYALYDHAFHWRLPLASLLPKKVDPATHEEFPGSYVFNPYTGARLSPRP